MTPCQCGCGALVTGSFVRGHNRRVAPDLSRFRVEDRGYVTPCWIWTGPVDPKGYGRIQIAGRNTYAHRASLATKEVVPATLQVDHLCRQTSCINPDHLEAVTCKVNMERRYATQTHCKHGHPLSGDNLYLEGHFRRCRTCRRGWNAERRRAA